MKRSILRIQTKERSDPVNYRTDLAMEAQAISGGSKQGIISETEISNGLKISRMHIISEEAAGRLGKPAGRYVTIEGLPETDNFREVRKEIEAISRELEQLLPKKGCILVIGIGNTEITPDALGPESAASVIATRHIGGELAKSAGLDKLRPVAVLSPGVLGQTGIEVGEIITSLAAKLRPAAVIAIDALASRSLSHLGRTIQLSDSGIAPGSGIGNHRLCLNERSLGIPVIGMGMPTVVDALTLAKDIAGTDELPFIGSRLIVTPKEIDILNRRASKLIGMAVNCALQKQYDFDELACLVA